MQQIPWIPVHMKCTPCLESNQTITFFTMKTKIERHTRNLKSNVHKNIQSLYVYSNHESPVCYII